MKRLIFILPFLLASPASAAIARSGSCSAATTSCTLSAVNTGDLVVVWAFRSGSTTAPSLPASNTSIATVATSSGGTTGSVRIYCRKASSGSDTGTGTATNASGIAAAAYSGTSVNATADCPATAVGGRVGNNAKTSTTMSYNGITMNLNDSTSWIVAGGANSVAATTPCTPSGGFLTAIATGGTGPAATIFDSNAVASSYSTGTCTITSTTWLTYVIEITSANPSGYSMPQSQTKTGSGGSIASNAMGSALTNPSHIVVSLTYTSAGLTTTCTDTAGNTYTDSGQGDALFNSSAYAAQMQFASNNHTTASNVVTCTNTGAPGFIRQSVLEFTGVATSSPKDASNENANASSGAGTVNNMSTGAATTTKAGDLCYGFMPPVSGSVTAGAGFVAGVASGSDMWRTVNGTPSFTVRGSDSSASDAYAGIVICFKPPASSAVRHRVSME